MGEDGGGGSARRRTQQKKKTGEDGRRREKTRGDERRQWRRNRTNERGKMRENKKEGAYCHAAPGGEKDTKWCPHQGSNPRFHAGILIVHGRYPLDYQNSLGSDQVRRNT